MKRYLLALFSFMIILLLLNSVAYRMNTREGKFEIEKSISLLQEPVDVTMNHLSHKKPGIYYFGYQKCPWCEEFLPILDEVLKENNQKSIVVNIKTTSFTKKHKRALKQFYETYENGEVSVPYLVIINSKGNVYTHVGTLSEHNAHKEKLTNSQRNKLKSVLRRKLRY
ncbi:TlpA family protein disulfide reductase [Streptococcus uberis]|uniref:TlpA family protein disulfide reductase n=1 Tax=Streptococcus uberis TaxID=1349 RepID=UPI0038D39640